MPLQILSTKLELIANSRCIKRQWAGRLKHSMQASFFKKKLLQTIRREVCAFGGQKQVTIVRISNLGNQGSIIEVVFMEASSKDGTVQAGF